MRVIKRKLKCFNSITKLLKHAMAGAMFILGVWTTLNHKRTLHCRQLTMWKPLSFCSCEVHRKNSFCFVPPDQTVSFLVPWVPSFTEATPDLAQRDCLSCTQGSKLYCTCAESLTAFESKCREEHCLCWNIPSQDPWEVLQLYYTSW